MSKKRKNLVDKAQNLTSASIVETLTGSTGSTMPWVVFSLKNRLEKTTLISRSIINQSTIRTNLVFFTTNPSPLNQRHIRSRPSKTKATWQSSLTITI
jgi:hypothetical protein